jgi:hypothetical protein
MVASVLTLEATHVLPVVTDDTSTDGMAVDTGTVHSLLSNFYVKNVWIYTVSPP